MLSTRAGANDVNTKSPPRIRSPSSRHRLRSRRRNSIFGMAPMDRNKLRLMCQQKEQLADYRKQFVDKTRRLSGAPTDASLLKHQNNFKTGHEPYLAPRHIRRPAA